MWQPDERGDSGVGFILVGLHLKSVLLDKLFSISRNCLTLRGAVPPGPARPKYQSIRTQKIRDLINIHVWLLVK